MTLTPEDIARLKSLMEKATDAPLVHRWNDDGQKPDRYFASGSHYIETKRDDARTDGINVAIMQNLSESETAANAELFVLLRNQAPSLLAAAERCGELEKGAFIRSRSQLTGRLPQAYSDDDLLKMFGPWWTKGDTTGLGPREVRLLETVADRNLQISEGRKLTCVYCGHEYPFDDVSAEQLDAHIRQCDKHPLKAAESRATQAEARVRELEAEVERAKAVIENYELDYERVVVRREKCGHELNEDRIIDLTTRLAAARDGLEKIEKMGSDWDNFKPISGKQKHHRRKWVEAHDIARDTLARIGGEE